MEFNIKTGQPEKLKTKCLVLPVFEPGKLPEPTLNIDKALGGLIKKLIKSGDISGKAGETLLIPNLLQNQAERILLIGCGKESEFNDKSFREAISRMLGVLSNCGAKEAVCYLTDLKVADFDSAWKIQQATVASMGNQYRFDEFKSNQDKKKEAASKAIKRISWVINNKRDLNKAEHALKAGIAIGEGMKILRDLGNTPPNICTPDYMAKAATKVAKEYKNVSIATLERKDMQALKMGALLSVAQGSPNPPKLVALEYRGAAKSSEPIVLVGKGITFDTGGNSLKPPTAMIGMKYDMCGAATVLGAIKFAAEMALPINLVGVMVLAENMPGSTASRPDDIVTTMSGLTVEILNTDAEGRLILSDALTYCERFNPKVVIDIATLTGACVVALGNHHSGLFSNYQPLAEDLLKAGRISGDKCWQLPLTDEYMRQLDSNFADLANVGGSEGGSITAASFLARFTKKYHWAHLDVAGTAFRTSGKERGATGQPMHLIAQYLLNI